MLPKLSFCDDYLSQLPCDVGLKGKVYPATELLFHDIVPLEVNKVLSSPHFFFLQLTLNYVSLYLCS